MVRESLVGSIKYCSLKYNRRPGTVQRLGLTLNSNYVDVC